MSDISFRFDGLLLAAVLALMAMIFAAVALACGVGAAIAQGERRDLARRARMATVFAVVAIAGTVIAAAYMDRLSMAATGPDWVDWLVLPALVLFALGCWRIARSPSR